MKITTLASRRGIGNGKMVLAFENVYLCAHLQHLGTIRIQDVANVNVQ